MTTVLAAGVFDFFHPGHRFFLRSAKALGDHLVVIVARDQNVFRFKGFFPHQNENERLEAVRASGLADEVILGSEEGDLLSVVKKAAPDILAIGYDQKLPEGLRSTFPDIEIIKLPAVNPQKWKSTRLRAKTRKS